MYCLILPQLQEELAEKYGLGEPVAANMIYTKYRCDKRFVQMILAQNSSIWIFIKIGRLRKSEKTQNDYFLFAVLPAQTTSSASSPGDQPDLHHHHPHCRHLDPDVAQIHLVRVPSPFLFPASTMDLSASRRNKI